MGKADDVAVDIGERVIDGVAHTSLGGEIHNALRPVRGESFFRGPAIGNIDTQVGV